MCGIAGIWSEPQRGLEAVAGAMADAIAHRGPDSRGTWCDEPAGLALGHRRLAILDLSEQGHQPMLSASGRFVVAFNGEIYNYRDIRRDLPQHHFASGTDTEVLLAAVEQWGVTAAASRFVGMFAFALWDRRERTLTLVRDRLGIKPLYYGVSGGALLFGSELKALRAAPSFEADIDRDSLALMLRTSAVPTPRSIYRGIRKLPPGTCITLRQPQDDATPTTWWSAAAVAERGLATSFSGSAEEAIAELDGKLREAVALRMIADVPLGAFLSGGIDSSTVVALMQAQSSRPVRTFTIGTAAGALDEAAHARDVARHLGTEHTELYVTPEDARSVIPSLPAMFDEPFADSSQIPTFLVSRLARRDVTVALSGDGGDELFAGYNRHVWGNRVESLVRRVPGWLRHAAAGGLRSLSADAWDRLYRPVTPLLPRALRVRSPGYKAHKFAGVLAVRDLAEYYHAVTTHWDHGLVLHGRNGMPEWFGDPAGADPMHRMLYRDLVTYLPDDILTKVDRASMAVALEARVPLLDHRVVEFAWQLPLSLKLREGGGKWLLRAVLERYVPRAMFDRPKAGFAVPIAEWLRGPLRDWAEALLDEQRLRTEGYLDPAPVRAAWTAHLAGRGSWEHHLWDVLMFQAWLEAQRAAVVFA